MNTNVGERDIKVECNIPYYSFEATENHFLHLIQNFSVYEDKEYSEDTSQASSKTLPQTYKNLLELKSKGRERKFSALINQIDKKPKNIVNIIPTIEIIVASWFSFSFFFQSC